MSNPLVRIADSGALADVADTVEFRVWKNPDQMRAMSLRGDVDFIAIPTNVAGDHHRSPPLPVELLTVERALWGFLVSAGLGTVLGMDYLHDGLYGMNHSTPR